MENAVKKSLLILLLLGAVSAFANYQSPASTPSRNLLSLPSFQSQEPEARPEVLLVYDDQGVLDLIAYQDAESELVRVFEPLACEASAESACGVENSGGWSQNRVTCRRGNKLHDGATTAFAGGFENALWGHSRYYDPELGRFTQTDPMGYADSMNLYQAFGQSPQNFNDPMGLVTAITAETGLPADLFPSANFETGMPWLDYTLLGAINTVASGAGRVANYGWNAVAGAGWVQEKLGDFAIEHLGASPADIECLNLYLIANPAEVALAANSLRIGGAQAAEKIGELLQRAKRVGVVANKPAQLATIKKPLTVIEINGFRLAKHGEMPSPRLGTESHHGVMSKWMIEHFPGYNKNLAPAVLMPEKTHHLTFGVYSRWHAKMRKQMGGTFDWSKVTEADIRGLSEQMFQVSGTPQEIVQGYWEWFDRMISAIQRQHVASGVH